MKYLYLLSVLFISQVSISQFASAQSHWELDSQLNTPLKEPLNCDQWARAVNTDQKDMVMAVIFSEDAFNMDVRQVYSSKIENYVSWKGEQQNCAANVLHKADLEIKSIETTGQLCTQTFTLHRFDNFLIFPTITDYKIRDLKKTCASFTPLELQTVRACYITTCPMVGNARTFPDYTDNCTCKLFDDMIRFKDESANYENFFDPQSVFEKPESVESPFE